MGRIWVGRRQDLWRFAVFLVLLMGLALFVKSSLPRFLNSSPVMMGPMLPVTAQATPVGNTKAGFFSEFRLQRDSARGAQQDYIREVMAGNGIDAASKKDASTRYMHLAQLTNQEAEAENLIKGLGFAEAAVWLGADGAQVFVQAGNLDGQQVARIADAVQRVSGVKAQSISISPRSE